jgi:hypothetical protein
MRDEGQRLHPSAGIRWVDDSLPALDKVYRLGLSFDFILLSAVWMHVAPADRRRAFRKLIALLKPGGRLAITLRQGPAEPERAIHAVSQGEIEALARAHGALIERVVDAEDHLGRGTITWKQMAIRLPDDGTGALPLLRHIILNDRKSSTYKLALLRVLCRIADSAAGYSRDVDEQYVAIPLGLVALYWIRLFKPLLAAGLPQSRRNIGYEKLGFVRAGFRALSDVSHLDLRIGTVFGRERSSALHEALRDAAEVISQMPAHYTTYANGDPVFPVRRTTWRIATSPRPETPYLPGFREMRSPYVAFGNDDPSMRVPPRTSGRRIASVHLDADYLFGFGEMRVPRHLWRALQRFDVWIEPALIAEWARLMSEYSEQQGRPIPEATLAAAMAWSDPTRDVKTARDRALHLVASSGLHCVWTGRILTADTLDVDHCFPWSAWPCDDLWNLLPVHRDVNQRQKRHKLPGAELLRTAQSRIVEWWDAGYVKANETLLPERFVTEARATLPLLGPTDDGLDDIFGAVTLQQARLKYDQQVPEWEPLRSTAV